MKQKFLIYFALLYSITCWGQDSLHFINKYEDTTVVFIVSFNDYKVQLKMEFSDTDRIYNQCISYLTEYVKNGLEVTRDYEFKRGCQANYKIRHFTQKYPILFEKCLFDLLMDKKLEIKDCNKTYKYNDIEITEEPYYRCHNINDIITEIDYVLKSKVNGQRLTTITKTYLEEAFKSHDCF